MYLPIKLFSWICREGVVKKSRTLCTARRARQIPSRDRVQSGINSRQIMQDYWLECCASEGWEYLTNNLFVILIWDRPTFNIFFRCLLETEISTQKRHAGRNCVLIAAPATRSCKRYFLLDYRRSCVVHLPLLKR